MGFVGTNQDTNLTVWASSDCPSPAGPPIACSEDAGPGCGTLGWQSSVSFTYSAGATYLVRVGSFSNADQGTFKITVTAVGAASKSQIGPGCSDGGGAGPTLDLDAPPVLGSTRIVSITGAAPAAPGILMMSPPGTPSALTGGCTLYLSGSEITFLFFLGTSGAGSWSTPVSVPSDPNLEGVHVFVQGVIFPPSLIPFYQVTSGLDLELGY